MMDRLAAELLLLLHLAFVLFAVLGGLLLLRWRWVAWLHLPAALWAVLVEAGGWICPLTPLENRFRARAGLEAYEGSFIERILRPALYPEGLTRRDQLLLGGLLLLLNLSIYAWILRGGGARGAGRGGGGGRRGGGRSSSRPRGRHRKRRRSILGASRTHR